MVLHNILCDFGIPMKLVRLIKLCLNATHDRVQVGKHLCDMYPIKNYLKAGDALSPLCFDFALVYVIRSGFGGLGVACWPLVPKFAGSNPAEAVGFFRAKKSSARLPSEGK